ncbi:MAG: SAM-dependent methyltransferase [Chloroflexi bacterium]|nr:SAM-dependent methyltransferase [Chloroflexota bacterium]
MRQATELPREGPSLDEELDRRLAAGGRMTFAQLMELALYWPRGGYYARPREAGRDYFTAPEAHPAFGALLALQLEEMWVRLGRPSSFTVAEQGAGGGALARDVTAYTRRLDEAFQEALRYVAVDLGWTPASEPGGLVRWVKASGLPFRGITGCILSNELLDALPVHRVVMRGGRLRELWVAREDGDLREVEGELSSSAVAAFLEDEGVALGEGQRAEVCLALEPWVEGVTQALERGYVLTVDYGHPAKQLYSLERSRGTLRCYYRNTLSANPYVHVGRQDMTAHVDFTAAARLGTRHGLVSAPLASQAAFLRNLGLGTLQRRLSSLGLPQRERDANSMALLELARPGGMGDFKVLVQGKGAPLDRLAGLGGGSPPWRERLASLPLPLLDSAHLSLLEGRYPHAGQPWEELWR